MSAVAKEKVELSLEERIEATEAKLTARQQAIGQRVGGVGMGLRETLGSPLTLLLVAGGGFALGHFLRKRARRDADLQEMREFRDNPPTIKPTIFATLLDAVTLVTTVMGMIASLRAKDAVEGVTPDEVKQV